MTRRPHISSYRWIICTLLFFATTVNYIDRQILSLLKPILDDQFHWTNAQFGMINSAFQAAYGIGLFFFGWFIDRFGTKVGFAVSIASWSLAALGHALVTSIGGFFAARIALGLGEGGNFPAAVKAVAQWFPQRERALATALFNSGSNVGAIIAPAVVPWVAYAFGWQWAFVFAGLAGFVWIAAWLPLYGAPETLARVSAAEREHILGDQTAVPQETSAPLGFRQVLHYRKAWSFIVCKFLTDPVWWFFLIWLPDFFKKTRGLDIKSSWLLLVTIYAIVTVLSIALGWLPGYLAARGMAPSRARKIGLFVPAILVLPILAVSLAGNWTAVILIGLAGAAHQAWSANLFSTVSDMFPKTAVATLTGIGGMAGSIGGILFPIACGLILDRFPDHGYTFLFGICGLAYIVAFAVNQMLAPNFDPVKIRAAS